MLSNQMQCDLKRPKISVQRKFVCLDKVYSFYDLSAFYNDKNSNNGNVIPDNDQSDETDNSGKPIPNPMPDDLDAPLQFKYQHKYYLDYYFGHWRGHH